MILGVSEPSINSTTADKKRTDNLYKRETPVDVPDPVDPELAIENGIKISSVEECVLWCNLDTDCTYFSIWKDNVCLLKYVPLDTDDMVTYNKA